MHSQILTIFSSFLTIATCVKSSKRFSFNSRPNYFKPVQKFYPSVPHISTVVDFCNFSNYIFSSALFYCTAKLLSSCSPSSVRPSVRKPRFSETAKRINAKLWEKVLVHHISTPSLFVCFLFFFKFFIFLFFFLHFYFVSVNMGVKISNDIASESTHQIHSPRIIHSCKPGSGVGVLDLQKVLKGL